MRHDATTLHALWATAPRRFATGLGLVFLLAGCNPATLAAALAAGAKISGTAPCRSEFEKLDANSNGSVELAEWQKARNASGDSGLRSKELQLLLKNLDANQDGKLQPAEYDALCAPGAASPSSPLPSGSTSPKADAGATGTVVRDGIVSNNGGGVSFPVPSPANKP